MKSAVFSPSVPEFVGLLGETLLEKVEIACRLCFSPVFRASFSFLSSVQIGAQMQQGASFHLSLLGLWETEERRNSTTQLFIEPFCAGDL